MLKRILIDIGIILGVVLLFVGFVELRAWRAKVKARKELAPFMADIAAQRSALLALGDVDLNPADLTFAGLEQKLRQPGLKKEGTGSTAVGWACGKENCAIWGFFPVSSGREIPSNAQPRLLMLVPPTFKLFSNLSFGGIHLGDSQEKLMELSRKRGIKSTKDSQHFRWDQDWDLGWTDQDGKIFSFSITNITDAGPTVAEHKSTVRKLNE